MLVTNDAIDISTGTPLICVLNPCTFNTTTHVSLSQRVVMTAEPPTRAAVKILVLPYARPSTVMAVWLVCGTVLGVIMLTRMQDPAGQETHADKEVLPVNEV
jgi:hypothetical protein